MRLWLFGAICAVVLSWGCKVETTRVRQESPPPGVSGYAEPEEESRTEVKVRPAWPDWD